jgi:hypothetical protein
MLVLLAERIYEVVCSYDLGWHDIITKFHDDRFWNSGIIKVNTSTV